MSVCALYAHDKVVWILFCGRKGYGKTMNQNAKTLFAALLIITTIVYASQVSSSMSKMSMVWRSSDILGWTTVILLLVCLPLFVLIGTGVLWCVSLFRSGKPDSDSSLLGSSAVSSITSSAIAAVVCAALFISDFITIGYVDSSISSLNSMSSYYSQYDSYSGGIYASQIDMMSFFKTVLIICLVLLAFGTVSLIITSIARKMFYSSVEKVFKGEASSTKAASLFSIMKFANIAIRVGIIVVSIMLISKTNSAGMGMFDWTLTIFEFLTLAAGSIACVIEAMMAKKFTASLNAPTAPEYAPYPPQDNYSGYGSEAVTQQADYTGYEPAQQEYQAPVQEQPVCPACGAPDNGTASFCRNCGNRLR